MLRPNHSYCLASLSLLLCACFASRGITALPGPVDSEEPLYDARRGELTIVFPAIDLPAKIAYDDVGIMLNRDAAAPADVWLHGYEVEVLDAHGSPIRTTVLHHMNIMAADKRELFSPIMLRLAGVGTETGRVRGPNALGVPFSRGDRIHMAAMLHNPSATAYPDVRVRIRFFVSTRADNPWAADAFPFHLQAAPPERSSEFDLPVGRSEHVWEAKPALSGRVIGFGGHMHRYGESLRLEDVTEGKVIWSANAVTDSTGSVLDFPRTRFIGRGRQLYASHVYRITAVYNNTSGKTLKSAGMGTIGGLIVPDRKANWPVVDPGDPIYLADRALRLGPGVAVHQHR